MNLPLHGATDLTGHSKDPARPRLLTLREAAALLNLHPNTVRAQVRDGILPGARIGRGWRFLESDLIAWMRSRYRKVPGVQSARDDRNGLWIFEGVELALAGSRHSTERALDALLEPASKAGSGNSRSAGA